MRIAERTQMVEETWLRDYWYVGCASSRLRRRPIAVRVLDNDIVLFRANGKPVALADRCPHRGVELSLGRVVSEGIACRYHGWRFDTSGRCLEIPSLVGTARIPAACQVKGFPSTEQDGYVWIWMGDEAPVEPAPRLVGFTSRRWTQGSIDMACSWLKGVENNLDWCHPAFVHRWTHPQFFTRLLRGARDTSYEVRATKTGCVVFSPPTLSAELPIPKDSDVILRFDLPNRVTVEIARGLLIVVLQFVPTGEQSCRMEWMNAVPIGPRLRWSNREGIVNRQDRRVLESAQRSGGSEISVKADASTLTVRQVVAHAVEGRWPTHIASTPRRRVVAVRV